MARDDRPPSFQMYPRDILTSQKTAVMTLEERGAYCWLLFHSWLSDQPGTLPNDPTLLAALSGANGDWPRLSPAVMAAWLQTKGRLVQPRLVAERERQIRRLQQAIQGGKLRASGKRDSKGRLTSSPTPPLAVALESKEARVLSATLPTVATQTLECIPMNGVVKNLASGKALTRPPSPDRMPRERLWEVAQKSNPDSGVQAGVMRLAGWLWSNQRERDVGMIEEIMRSAARAKNPYAYFSEGGQAIEGLRSRVANDRAVRDKARIKAEEADFLGEAR